MGRGTGICNLTGSGNSTDKFLGQGSDLLYILFVVGIDID